MTHVLETRLCRRNHPGRHGARRYGSANPDPTCVSELLNPKVAVPDHLEPDGRVPVLANICVFVMTNLRISGLVPCDSKFDKVERWTAWTAEIHKGFGFSTQCSTAFLPR
jgi:hypothetical protein